MNAIIQSGFEKRPFLAASYRGREIAAYHHSQGWMVYVDNVLQENRVFATDEDAMRWMRRRIDEETARRASAGGPRRLEGIREKALARAA